MKENIDDILHNVIEKFEFGNRVVLDISAYPELSKIVEAKERQDVIYYIPDTIPLLLEEAEKEEQYYSFLSKLFTKWTQRSIDLKLLNKIFIERKYNNLKFKLITKEMIDEETYNFCYDRIVKKDLLITLPRELKRKLNFEPGSKFNLIGDIIGKILGFAKKNKVPILMQNQKLVRYVKKEIPVFDTANIFIDKKQCFFSRFIPLRRTRGIRWIIGITVGAKISPVGFILAVIDP